MNAQQISLPTKTFNYSKLTIFLIKNQQPLVFKGD